MTNDSDETLEIPRIPREDISVIGNADHRDTDRSDMEDKLGGICSSKTRVNVSFEVLRGPFVALSGTFVLLDFSA